MSVHFRLMLIAFLLLCAHATAIAGSDFERSTRIVEVTFLGIDDLNNLPIELKNCTDKDICAIEGVMRFLDRCKTTLASPRFGHRGSGKTYIRAFQTIGAAFTDSLLSRYPALKNALDTNPSGIEVIYEVSVVEYTDGTEVRFTQSDSDLEDIRRPNRIERLLPDEEPPEQETRLFEGKPVMAPAFVPQRNLR